MLYGISVRHGLIVHPPFHLLSVLQSLHEELEKVREEKSSAVESLKERMEELSEREGMLMSVEEELSDVKKLLLEKNCREQELEEMSEKQRRSLKELSQKHESLQSELNTVHTAREEEVDGRETLTALKSTLSAKDEEIHRLKEDLDQHLKDLTLTQEKLQKQSSLMVRRFYSLLCTMNVYLSISINSIYLSMSVCTYISMHMMYIAYIVQ